MRAPNPAYSVRIRVEISNVPGTLGRLATAIGDVGGNIQAIDIHEATANTLVRDLTVEARDEAHAEQIRAAAETVEGVRMLEVADRTFTMHEGGKIEMRSRIPVRNRDDLSMAYTPGVARVCMAIAKNPEEVHRYTIKKNTVAIVSDGTAVLGLGDIGPAGAIPVMEGKALLFKEFAGIDAWPICLDVTSAEEIIETVQRIAPVFGGINLEDIAAPTCFEVEERLDEMLDIPIFHDDQHGTAIVTIAALRNALKIVDKKIEDLKVVVAGVGAAGVAVSKMLLALGVPNIIGVDRKGAVYNGREELNAAKRWYAENTNPEMRRGAIYEVLPGADVFIGLSGPNIIMRDDLRVMAKDPIVFAMSNPDPEIPPEEAEGMVAVMATGRSDYPNQINNVLAFPGVFRGSLDAGATRVTDEMKMAAADAIAAVIPDVELSPGYVIPSVFNPHVVELVAAAVARTARDQGVCRGQWG
jgi:malate dehydrogenase (oxaloacetate-decarboxylating)